MVYKGRLLITFSLAKKLIGSQPYVFKRTLKPLKLGTLKHLTGPLESQVGSSLREQNVILPMFSEVPPQPHPPQAAPDELRAAVVVGNLQKSQTSITPLVPTHNGIKLTCLEQKKNSRGGGGTKER